MKRRLKTFCELDKVESDSSINKKKPDVHKEVDKVITDIIEKIMK